MKTKALLIVLALIATVACGTISASAHVLITDSSKKAGAILHVMPDDDPIAGQAGDIFFDIQGIALRSKTDIAQLTIRSSTGASATPITKLADNTVQARYTFPAQGAYELTLRVTSDGKQYTFTHPQRVSRGTTMNNLDTPRHMWAEAVIIAATCNLLVLCIVAINRRREIAEHSK